MALHVFSADLSGGAPSGFSGIRNTGISLMDVRHVVEVRAGRVFKAGAWQDVWQQDLLSHTRAELAEQHADKLRANGFTVRVRPVIL